MSIVFFSRPRPAAFSFFLSLLMASLAPIRSAAQDILAPPPLEYSQSSQTMQVPTASGSQKGPPLIALPEKVLQYGPIVFHPHLLYRFSYGDGIPARDGERDKTYIHELSPGLLFLIGDHWRLDYTPTLRYYSSSDFRDTLNHSVWLNGAVAYEEWFFSLSQRCALTSDPLVETGSQTDQEIYTTSLNASWRLGSHLSFDFGLSQSLRFPEEDDLDSSLTESKDWSTLEWVNYQIAQEFSVGLGVGFGYVDVGVGSDMTYEQVHGRIQWQASEKFGFMLSGGADIRQFLDTDVSDLVNPLFGLSLDYQPFEQTTLSIEGGHTVSASYFQDQVTETSSIGASLRQRLFGKLYLDVAGGYRLADYQSSAAGLTVEREDNNTYFDVRLTLAFLKRGTIAAFYHANENRSDDSEFTYSSDQIGFEIGFRY